MADGGWEVGGSMETLCWRRRVSWVRPEVEVNYNLITTRSHGRFSGF